MEKARKKRTERGPKSGVGQLTLVEHALCPLDAAASLRPNLLHETCYHYSDKDRRRQKATVRVHCPLGLSAGDELFLWGLLSLALSQPEKDVEFHATRHYCLRQLGLIDQHTRRGGRQYSQFTAALSRLSAVVYQNDAFYDPIRGEHRNVSFGFLSYSLPLDPESSRAWRIVWDPLFFELAQAAGGLLHFDLPLYRSLDPATRRLLLFLTKVFSRCAQSPRLEVRHLAVDVLGFLPTISTSDLKLKLGRSIAKLSRQGIVQKGNSPTLFLKHGRGKYSLMLQRGAYFSQPRTGIDRLPVQDSALWQTLQEIGLAESAIPRMMRGFPLRVVREWADITLAARERFGERFFRRSAAAYLQHNVRHAAAGTRTPPEWWHELRQAERRAQSAGDRRRRQEHATGETDAEFPQPSHAILRRIGEEVFGNPSVSSPADITSPPRKLR